MSTLFIGLALIALLLGLSWILAKREPMLRAGLATDVQLPRKGMIFTVGLHQGIIPMVLHSDRPDFVAFICTPASETVVTEITDTFGYDANHYKKKPVDPMNIKEIRDETRIVLDWMNENGLERNEIAADITGGMVPMSVGVFLAAEERNIDCQYIKSMYNEQNRPKRNTQEQVLLVPEKKN